MFEIMTHGPVQGLSLATADSLFNLSFEVKHYSLENYFKRDHLTTYYIEDKHGSNKIKTKKIRS